MEVRITPIPDGSHEVRIYEGEHRYGDKIDTVAVLRNLGDGCAEVALAHGHLSNGINIEIGKAAYATGYTRLRFYVPEGTHVTRWAHEIQSDEGGWDLWEVDLVKALNDAS
jgi:hypothetical protein